MAHLWYWVGLPTYWGNPVSEHAERHLSLIGIGRLLALSPNKELNALSARHYRMEFGAHKINTIRTLPSENPSVEAKTDIKHSGFPLFQETSTHKDLARLMAGGAEIKTTPLTDKFSYAHYLEQQTEKRIPLFAIDPGERIHPFSSEDEFLPKDGWKIIGLSVSRPLDGDN